MSEIWPMWVAGARRTSAASFAVYNPYDGSDVARVAAPSAIDIEDAVAAASAASGELGALPAHRRAAALQQVAEHLAARAAEIAALITSEAGKPMRWAEVEVERAVGTFRLAAAEALRFSGELQRLDVDPGGEGRLALIRRFPRGPVLGIAPFNFPLNLVAHKVAPALAVGAPIVVKPAPKTPLTALVLGEILAETDLPAGAFSVLPVANALMGGLVSDPRLPVVSFTGSAPVGRSIQRQVPDKHVVLELGGNAAVYIAEDWAGPDDLGWAARRIALYGNAQAGQSCVAVQRIFVERSLLDSFRELLIEAMRSLRTGDPADPATDVGPVIDEHAAERISAWLDEATGAGASVLLGGTRHANAVAPTLVCDVPAGVRLRDEEVFGPVMLLEAVDGLDDALRRINDSAFGLQAGVLTHDLQTAFRAFQALEVGGVIVGDVPTYRSDAMPYGGIKDSGVGREGVRAAMEDLTTPRTLVLSGVAL